jgi:hypothetical protein
MGERADFKPGDRVRKPDGSTGTVVEPPMYYEAGKGYAFTGWAVVVELDDDPHLVLTRIERGLSPGRRDFVRLDYLIHIAD